MASAAMATMASSANAQHNLAALQSQLLTLQMENATLTKELCVKENHVLQKEQQFRVLQQRMEELEGAVAAWKDRYLQQLQLNTAASAASAILSASASASAAANDSGEWTALPLPKPSSAQELPNADAMGSLVEKLSTAEREKLKALIGMERTRSAEQQRAPWDETFVDVSAELQSVLEQYLLPVLLETQRIENQRNAADKDASMSIQCLTKVYTKQATDFKIVCQRQSASPRAAVSAAKDSGVSSAADSSLGSADSSTASTNTRPTHVRTPSAGGGLPQWNAEAARVSSSGRGSYGAVTTSTSIASTTSTSSAQSPTVSERLPAAEEHLFDCVECENAKRGAPVPHGPREIHPTKAVYISRPLAPPPAASPGASSIRRYSLTPSKLSTSSASDSSRTMTVGSGLSITGYPSSSRSDAMSFHDSDGDRRSGASSGSLTGGLPPAPQAQKDSGKIKKIMGSMMKGLNRHKPQLTTTNPQLEEDDSICDGCGRGPLTGVKWVCRTCKIVKEQEYELCEKCYGQGLHGKENEDDLFERIEEIVVSKCPKLGREQELMKLLRFGICKANLKKYSFCLTWIADLLLCKSTTELRARALEISQISPQVRSEFVRLLTELLSKYRRNIELITEWQPVTNVATSSASPGAGSSDDGTGSSMLQLDTLRIWVKDIADSGGGQ